MLPKELTEDLSNRLATVQGQVGGLMRMVSNEADPDQILIQFKAAQQGLEKAHYLLLDEVFRKTLALKLVDVINTCPGDCPDTEKIAYIKNQFPTIELNDLTAKIKEINEISIRLKNYNKNNSR